MAVTQAQIDGFKSYARIDDTIWTTDGDLCTVLLNAAAEYLADAGAAAPEDGEELDGARYNLALWALALHWYDHRDSVGSEAPLPLGLRPVLQQLKHRGEVSVE